MRRHLFLLLHSHFELRTSALPPHVRLPPHRLVHPRQLLLLLLLHAAQERLGVGIGLAPLLARLGLGLLLPRRLVASGARPAAPALLLHGPFLDGDLEVALRRGVAGTKLQRAGVIADGVV